MQMVQTEIQRIIETHDENLFAALIVNLDLCLEELKSEMQNNASAAAPQFMIFWFGMYKLSMFLDQSLAQKKIELESVLQEENQINNKEVVVIANLAKYIQNTYLFKLFDFLINKVSAKELHQIGLFLTENACPNEYYKELLTTLRYGLNMVTTVASTSQEEYCMVLEGLYRKKQTAKCKYPECSICFKLLDFTSVFYDDCPHPISVFCGGAVFPPDARTPANYVCQLCPASSQNCKSWLTQTGVYRDTCKTQL